MRKVADSSFLQSEALRAYLSGSTNNYVVLTDYAAQEAYKQDTLTSIYRRMEVLVEFPTQVIVLKGTRDVCGLKGRYAASPERLIDETQTREFSEFCDNLLAAERGDVNLQGQLLEHGREAKANIDRMLQGAPLLASGMALVEKSYTPAELGILRRGEPSTPQMAEKLVSHILLLTTQLIEQHPEASETPRGAEVRNTFLFRYALCAYVLILKRIKSGSTGNLKPETLRNDLIDVNFAAFATYFDGFLTADKQAAEIYAEAEFLLRERFATPPFWVRIWFSLLRDLTALLAVLRRLRRSRGTVGQC